FRRASGLLQGHRAHKATGGGESPAARRVTYSDAVLLAGRRAFRNRDTSRIRRLVDEDGARHQRATRQVVVRHGRVPTATRDVERDEVVAGRGAPAHLPRGRRTGNTTNLAGDVGAVLDGVGEERLLSRDQVTKVGLHRSDVGLPLRISELRDRDGGQDADDHHHDQQLDERKTLAVHLTHTPVWNPNVIVSDRYLRRECPLDGGGKARAPPHGIAVGTGLLETYALARSPYPVFRSSREPGVLQVTGPTA